VKRFGTHCIGRHSFAHRVLQNGRSLPFLKEAGRWATLSTVQRYAHIERSPRVRRQQPLQAVRFR
jgi:site-specific recombinase XerD